MRRIRLTVAYDGTDFHGWQVQPGQETVQGWLARVASGLEGTIVDLQGSGRTDAGVHAVGQVAAMSISNRIPCDNLVRAMNRLLPDAIRVMDACEVAPEFHPRFDARRKTYQYRIWRSQVCPPMRRLYVCHHPYPLDEIVMEECAALIVGEHDFSAFAAADEKDDLGLSKVRRVFSSICWREGEELVYEVCGNGFLKHMVRFLAGTLLETGKGNLSPAGILARLAPGFEGKAGPAMPACGLCLMKVEY
jgi:tRNA pseudouridine38-40 synthase